MVAQPEENPVSLSTPHRSTSREERERREKSGKARKRHIGSVVEENKVDTERTNKKRKCETESDQKKSEEIANLEELLEKKKRELEQVSHDDKLSSREESERSNRKRARGANKQPRDAKVNKPTKAQIKLSWIDDQNSEEGDSSVELGVRLCQDKGQRHKGEDSENTSNTGKNNKPGKSTRRFRPREQVDEEEESKKTPLYRRTQPKVAESAQKAKHRSDAKGLEEKNTAGNKTQSVSPRASCGRSISPPPPSPEPSSARRTEAVSAPLPKFTPCVTNSTSSSDKSSSTASCTDKVLLKTTEHQTEGPCEGASELKTFLPAATPTSNTPCSKEQRSSGSKGQPAKKDIFTAFLPIAKEFLGCPSTSNQHTDQSSTSAKVPSPTREKAYLSEKEEEEVMEWEEVDVEQAVEASSRVRELLKEEVIMMEVMEGVEEEGERDMVPAAEGQHGKLVMVVDTNVLLSNGFPLVQELIQRGVCTVFLPWQVPSEYELKIFWVNGDEAPSENGFECRSYKNLIDINLALRLQFR